MKVGVLGTGMVGETIASKLTALGHSVKMGARAANNPKASAWVVRSGPQASHGTFADAAAFGDLIFNCTLGSASLDALRSAGEEVLGGKTLVDVANPLDFSHGMPPRLFVSNTDSLGEQIQRAFPTLKVVKTLNTVTCGVMVEPARVKGEHTIFICGNDGDAKARVRELLTGGFGWKDVIDLGDITAARATESFLPLWVRLYGVLGTADFNVRLVR
ncbi:MAG TPA: NAD(P)-binding domain-containing protein [Myxococcaceae bacterium]|nr:NAD(P)-binding domain-containing protein [Myxococcaceae bacterium]